MKLALSPRHHRILAIALAVAALSACVAASVLPTLWLHARYDDYIEQYSDRIQRYRRVAAMTPRIEESLRIAEKRDSAKLYLKAGSPTLAAAELQGILTKIVEENQGKVFSSQVVAPKDDAKKNAPGKIGVSLQLGAAVTPLQIILYTIETSAPYLFIDQMSVTSNQGRGYKPVPGVQPEFAVQLSVHAYMSPSVSQQ